MANNKKCPHCGGEVFRALIKTPGLVSVDTDGNFTVISKANNELYEILQCQDCKTNITEEDLSSKVCKSCGQVITHGDLNAEGKCIACVAMEKNEALATASKEEILRLFLESQMANKESFSKKADEKLEKVQAKAEVKVENEEVEVTAEATVKETTKPVKEVVEETVAETKPRRRRRSSTETTEEPAAKEDSKEKEEPAPVEQESPATEQDMPPVTETPVTPQENPSEAPFPSTPDLFDEAAKLAEQPAVSTTDFPMFSEDEEVF